MSWITVHRRASRIFQWGGGFTNPEAVYNLPLILRQIVV